MFLNSPHRETPKNVIKKKSRKSRFWIFGRIFCKNFSTRFFLQNVFCSVFELPSLRNTRKRDKTKKVEEKLTSKIFVKILEKVFDMDFLQKYFYGVFELPLPRNAQKRTKKKVKEFFLDGGWVGLRFSKCTGGVRRFFFARPLATIYRLSIAQGGSQEIRPPRGRIFWPV